MFSTKPDSFPTKMVSLIPSFLVNIVFHYLARIIAIYYRILYSFISPYAVLARSEEETHYVDQNGRENQFPNISEKPTVELSVVIPAYNEQHRLKPMLDSCLLWLTTVYLNPFEVIVVSDGSTDGTCDLVMEYVQKYSADRVRLLKLTKNRGKGAAVAFGMLSARGNKLLFADADGATQFGDIVKLESALQTLTKNANITSTENNFSAVVCGSRAHLEKELVAQRSLYRSTLTVCSHILIWTCGIRSVKDTQCGFKLFTRPAARILFNNLHVKRWAFDVELLYVTEMLNISLAEVAVSWKEIEGSKMIPVYSWIQMGCDILSVWVKYNTGLWRVRVETEN